MPTKTGPYFLLISCLLMYNCKQDSTPEEVDSDVIVSKVVTTLPMTEISLDDFSSFEKGGKNWTLGSSVYSDYVDENSFEKKEGSGVLVNKMVDGSNSSLETSFDHGDLELSFDFMMPKESNSGIYFQGRYELQLADSYGKDELSISDLGAIYERWDDTKPVGKKGYEGYPPLVNACKLPGLWQNMKIYFRAPKFDNDGKKSANARFDYVFLNGVKIQDNVELTGPTRGGSEKETLMGPLIIQGDHGNVAFKNIKYKSYSQDSLELVNLKYQYFEHTNGIAFPNFDSIEILKEGDATFLDVNIANELENHYGLIFTGKLSVPIAGEYLFKTGIDDGGDLLIDNELVVHNEGNPGYDIAFGRVTLGKGDHEFELRYYDDVWNASIAVDYEGPGIYQHQLSPESKKKKNRSPESPIKLESVTETEMLRSFVMYGGEKKTHAISVASPRGIHYSYDLSEGALLKFWRGSFGDVTKMWKNRGEPQIIEALNATIEGSDGSPFIDLKSENLKYLGYDINEANEPIFKYELNDLHWTDHLSPSSDKKMLERTLTVSEKATIRIASGNNIEKLSNGLYSINGLYYLDAENATINGDELLLSSDDAGTLSYKLLW